MSKSKKEEGTELITTTSQVNEGGLLLAGNNSLASSVPDFLRENAGEGTEEIREYLRPGRIKVMQSNRTQTYAEFPEGSVIVTPVNMLLAENEQKFHFVPLLFFPEWCTMNPFAMKDKLPFVREQSFDPRSDIAAKARNKDTRAEPCPENPKFMIKHKQFFNFVCYLVCQPELSRIPVVLSFSGGEFGRGQRLSDQIAMKASQCPIWGQVYEARVPKTKRVAEQGEWFGIDVSPPTVEGIAPFVMNADEAKILQEAHRELKRLHAEKLLQVDHEEEELENATVAESGESKY